MAESTVTLTKVIQVSLLLFVLLIVTAAASLFCGPAETGLLQGFKDFLRNWSATTFTLKPEDQTILFSIRLPRIIFAGLVGASLSTAGVIFQALLRNPLADHFNLGILVVSLEPLSESPPGWFRPPGHTPAGVSWGRRNGDSRSRRRRGGKRIFIRNDAAGRRDRERLFLGPHHAGSFLEQP
jgi:hypothetical protein